MRHITLVLSGLLVCVGCVQAPRPAPQPTPIDDPTTLTVEQVAQRTMREYAKSMANHFEACALMADAPDATDTDVFKAIDEGVKARRPSVAAGLNQRLQAELGGGKWATAKRGDLLREVAEGYRKAVR